MTDQPRDLSESKSAELRSILHQEIKNANTGGAEEEAGANEDGEDDVSDLLDYALAMVANGKSVSYIVTELSSMEMDICTPDTAGKIGARIDTYLAVPESGGGGEKAIPDTTTITAVAASNEEQTTAKGDTTASTTTTTTPTTTAKIVSLKSTRGSNALSESGALGTRRLKNANNKNNTADKKKNENRNNNQKKEDNESGEKEKGSVKNKGNALTMSGALGASRDAGGGNKASNSGTNSKKRDHSQSQKRKNGSGRGGGGNNNNNNNGGAGRSIASEAFRRLAQQKDHERPEGRFGNRGRGGDRSRDDRIGGRHGDHHGRGGGRGGRGGDGGRGRGGRGGGGGRGGHDRRDAEFGRDGGRVAGQKRQMDRDRDFSNNKSPRVDNHSGRGGMGHGDHDNQHQQHHHLQGRGGFGRGQSFRGGRGGRGHQHHRAGGYEEANGTSEGNQHQKRDEPSQNYQEESNGEYNQTYSSSNTWFRGGRGRGGRFGRGGRGRGRGGRGDFSQEQEFEENATSQNNGDNATLEAAAASPSPLISAQFSTPSKLGYSGRGYAPRGGRGGFRGRGRGYPGRAMMFASKTWTRTKETPDGETS